MTKVEVLERKLEIAIECLKSYATEWWWDDAKLLNKTNGIYEKSLFYPYGYKWAKQALKEIDGVK